MPDAAKHAAKPGGLAGALLVVTLTLPVMLALPATTEATEPSAPILPQRNVSLALANGLAGATLEACRAMGRTAVVAVVDRGGNPVALQRGDDVGPHNTSAARRKAFTALSTETRTGPLAERARDDPASQNLNTPGELLLLGGGVPLQTDDGQVIGAVGVAGAGGAANDENRAMQAIRAKLPGAARTG